jgi:hypothetical protein
MAITMKSTANCHRCIDKRGVIGGVAVPPLVYYIAKFTRK